MKPVQHQTIFERHAQLKADRDRLQRELEAAQFENALLKRRLEEIEQMIEDGAQEQIEQTAEN